VGSGEGGIDVADVERGRKRNSSPGEWRRWWRCRWRHRWDASSLTMMIKSLLDMMKSCTLCVASTLTVSRRIAHKWLAWISTSCVSTVVPNTLFTVVYAQSQQCSFMLHFTPILSSIVHYIHKKKSSHSAPHMHKVKMFLGFMDARSKNKSSAFKCHCHFHTGRRTRFCFHLSNSLNSCSLFVAEHSSVGNIFACHVYTGRRTQFCFQCSVCQLTTHNSVTQFSHTITTYTSTVYKTNSRHTMNKW
jgi:hypothetical protein